jgi:hypothetical protein
MQLRGMNHGIDDQCTDVCDPRRHHARDDREKDQRDRQRPARRPDEFKRAAAEAEDSEKASLKRALDGRGGYWPNPNRHAGISRSGEGGKRRGTAARGPRHSAPLRRHRPITLLAAQFTAHGEALS